MIEGFKETLDKMNEIHLIKNNDYAMAQGGDPYKNFRLCEQLGICSVEKGILVRLCDKMSRICNLIESEGKVKDEKITDTLIDLANYAVILKCWIDEKK